MLLMSCNQGVMFVGGHLAGNHEVSLGMLEQKKRQLLVTCVCSEDLKYISPVPFVCQVEEGLYD